MSEEKNRNESILYPLMVIIFVLGMATYAALTKVELFPFAPFRMYSYGFRGEDLTLIRILCTNKEGQEVPVSFYRLLKVESYYTMEIEELLAKKDRLDDGDKERIRRHTVPLKKETQQWCSQLGVYKLYWDQFDGRKRDSPVSKELILEL